ncbi:MAG: AAA family ATPase [Gammaproteobacteria bacterium]|nr:AAA family ATPase [Gammaproteobacteria bacterium]
MLTRLEIENFYSIRHRQILDLAVARNAPDMPGRFGHPYLESPQRVPKVIALFGPNASGKSTVLRALTFLRWFARESFQIRPDENLPIMPFMQTDCWNRQIKLAVHFGAQLVENEPPCLYSYEVHIQPLQKGASAVVYEALKYSPRGKPRRLIERTASEVKTGVEFGASDLTRQQFRPNASVISTLAQFAHPLATKIYESLGTVLTNMFLHKFDTNPSGMTPYYSENPKVLERLNDHVQKIDLGIERIEIDQDSSGPQAKFFHRGLNQSLLLATESHGTQMFYEIFPVLNFVLSTGGLAIIDELDNDIHPLVLPEMVRWFHESSWNPHEGQLIMSCHNPALLEHLVKEEVFFTEKSREGVTKLFGLQDIKNVRRTDNLYRKYLGGFFGAVPRFG